VLWGACLLLIVANVINIAADLGGMAEATSMVTGLPARWLTPVFAGVVVSALFWSSYRSLARAFKWLTLVLFAYVITAFLAQPDWGAVLRATLIPKVQWTSEYLSVLVAILGTTISPYLFFWQAAQEVEELEQTGIKPRREKLRHVYRALRRLRIDTVIGMLFSNCIAFFVMLMGAVALHGAGVHDVRTAAQAAQALRPLAGDLAFTLFALGIVATGMLAVPVLASSAAYAVAEAFGWPEGLERHWREATGFYGIVTVATLAGTVLSFTPIDPMKALVWAAVINGVVSVPIMAAMMVLAGNPAVMGPLVVRRNTRAFGWSAVGLMAAAVVLMGHDLLT